MSNTKISQLPAATVLNPAADVAPIVSSGVTKKATPNLIVQSVLPSPGPIGATTPDNGTFVNITRVGASGLQKATAGVFSNAIAGTDYLGPTTGSAIQKANGTGGLTNAVSGTDYAPATSGGSILYGNGAGGFSNVIVGSGLQFTGGTLVSTSAGGSVTTVSVVAANGFAGTVADPSSTPAITLSTSVSGIVYGNAGALSAVTIGSGLTFAGGTLSASGSSGVTSVTATTPLASSGGSTPDISIQQASGSQSGYLSSTDWTTFNNKQPAGTYVTSISVASSNGLAGTSSGGATPTITLSTSVTGLLKGNGTSISAATSGTDYAPATSGTSILYGNGAGGFSSVTVGTGLSFSTGTLANSSPMTYPSSGIANSTGSAWGTSYSTTGTGTVVALATSPSFTTPVLGTPTSGTLSNCTVDGTNSVGYLNIPQNSQGSNYTLVAADSGKHIYNASGSSVTYTIPANGSVGYAIGTAITFVNMASSSVTISITTDTLYLAGTGSTGSRTLAQYGTATAIKITSTSWIITGNGLT